MSNYQAIHSVGNSLVTYLRNSYPEPLRTDHSCTFVHLSSGQLAKDDDLGTALSLFLYRVTMNEHFRNMGPVDNPSSAQVPLSVNLHYLLTVWADNALAEHSILAWAMLQIHNNPVLDLSSLSPEAEWERGDVVQFFPAELSNEDLMRVWDSVTPSYRLSFSYVARVVRINPGPDMTEHQRVVATRQSWTDREDEP